MVFDRIRDPERIVRSRPPDVIADDGYVQGMVVEHLVQRTAGRRAVGSAGVGEFLDDGHPRGGCGRARKGQQEQRQDERSHGTLLLSLLVKRLHPGSGEDLIFKIGVVLS